jgi:hypothetical protein
MSSITPRMEKILEIYKCALLTFIALARISHHGSGREVESMRFVGINR